MTIAFRAGVTATGGASSAAATIPATVAAGDLMLLVVTLKLTTAGAIQTPSGWTLLDGTVAMTGAVAEAATYWKIATGADASSTLTVTATGTAQQITWALAAYSGTNGSIRNHGLTDQGSSSSTSPSCGTQTSSAGDLIVCVAGLRGAANGAFSASAPAAYTLRETVSTTTAAAQNVGACIADGTTSGSQTLTTSVATWAVTGQIIIEPAQTIVPSGIASSATLGTLTLVDGSLATNPAGIASVVHPGSHTVTDGSMAAAPTGIGSAVHLGSHTLADGSLAVTPTGKPAIAALGMPSLADGSLAVSPAGAPVTVDLGAVAVLQVLAIAPNGLSAALGLGELDADQAQTIAPTGIAIATAAGAPATANAGPAGPVIRPSTGLVTRPNTGTVTRPSSGLVTRP